MSQKLTLYSKCNVCGGDGVVTTTGSQDGVPQQWESPCTACDGSGYTEWGETEIDSPTTAQFNSKFQEIVDGLQAIWNKVKNL